MKILLWKFQSLSIRKNLIIWLNLWFVILWLYFFCWRFTEHYMGLNLLYLCASPTSFNLVAGSIALSWSNNLGVPGFLTRRCCRLKFLDFWTLKFFHTLAWLIFVDFFILSERWVFRKRILTKLIITSYCLYDGWIYRLTLITALIDRIIFL